jgi:hypothetical protein
VRSLTSLIKVNNYFPGVKKLSRGAFDIMVNSLTVLISNFLILSLHILIIAIVGKNTYSGYMGFYAEEEENGVQREQD